MLTQCYTATPLRRYTVSLGIDYIARCAKFLLYYILYYNIIYNIKYNSLILGRDGDKAKCKWDSVAA